MGTPVIGGGAQVASAWSFSPGSCAWYAASVRPDIGSRVVGNAANWIFAAQRSGLDTGDTPAPDAIVVYQPGVQGAWGAGHVAHVLAVDPDGVHFLVQEMDYPIAGRVTQRMSHTGAGVSFIY